MSNEGGVHPVNDGCSSGGGGMHCVIVVVSAGKSCACFVVVWLHSTVRTLRKIDVELIIQR